MLTHISAMQDRKKKVGANGFTLIELLVVIVILGVLAAVVIIGIGAIQENAERESCNTVKKTLRTAAAAYVTSEDQNIPGADTPERITALETAEYLDEVDETYDIEVAATGEVTSDAECP